MKNMGNKIYIHSYYFDENITWYAEVYFLYENRLRKLIEFSAFRHAGGEKKAISRAEKFCRAFNLNYQIGGLKEIKNRLKTERIKQQEKEELRRLKEKYEKEV